MTYRTLSESLIISSRFVYKTTFGKIHINEKFKINDTSLAGLVTVWVKFSDVLALNQENELKRFSNNDSIFVELPERISDGQFAFEKIPKLIRCVEATEDVELANFTYEIIDSYIKSKEKKIEIDECTNGN